MPLPPLPANNTDRAWLKYTSASIEHEMVLRFASATTQADIITAVTSLANALKALMHTSDAFTGLRHQDSGSTVSFPLAWSNIAGTNTATPDTDNPAKFISIVGRSLAGYRVKATLFSSILADSNGYRITRASGNAADIFLDGVDGMPTPLRAIDGGLVVWNQYANLGYNAYWQREFRA